MLVIILQTLEGKKISKTIKQRNQCYIWTDDGKLVFQLSLFPT